MSNVTHNITWIPQTMNEWISRISISATFHLPLVVKTKNWVVVVLRHLIVSPRRILFHFLSKNVSSWSPPIQWIYSVRVHESEGKRSLCIRKWIPARLWNSRTWNNCAFLRVKLTLASAGSFPNYCELWVKSISKESISSLIKRIYFLTENQSFCLKLLIWFTIPRSCNRSSTSADLLN